MLRVVLLVPLTAISCATQDGAYSLSDLQGAWWSDHESPTADFAIQGDRIWLDHDSEYHPCRIAGRDTLVYELGPDMGTIKRRIVSLEGDTLVLEGIVHDGPTRTTYVRRE